MTAAPPDSLSPFARFDKHRRWNAPVARVLGMHEDTRQTGLKIARCMTRLGALLELPEEGDVRAHLSGGWNCQARLCPFCEWRRSLAWQSRLLRGLEQFAEDHPTHRAIFLTLTVRNCPITELRSTIGQLHAGWKRLTKLAEFPTAHWLRRTEVTVASPDGTVLPDAPEPSGNFLAADINRSEDDPTDTPAARLAPRPHGPAMVHPHLHCLLLVPASYYSHGYVTQLRWQQLWQMSARLDYPPTVDVRAAYNDEHKRSDRAPIGKVVLEAAKYICKAADVVKLGPYAVELHEELRGLRMIQASGRFSRYVSDKDITKDELYDALTDVNPAAMFAPVVAEWNQQQEAYELSLHDPTQPIGTYG